MTLGAPLVEPIWTPRPKREPGGRKKIASRARKTLINSSPLGNGGPGGLQKQCSRARETLTVPKRCAPVYVKHSLGKQDWSTRLPAGQIGAQNLASWPGPVTMEPPLAEPSWAARHKRDPGSQKKIASRAGKTLINFAPLGNGWPGGLQEQCSRARQTLTVPKRCAPVYVKHSLGKQDWSTRLPAGQIGAQNLASWPGPVTMEPPLAEPSWAARHKRDPGSQKKIASRAGKTLINFAPLGNGWPGGLQEQCSRLRETPTFPERCAPVYVKQPFLEWVQVARMPWGSLSRL